MSIRESLLRLVVSFETKAAIAGMKELDAAVTQTAANTTKAGDQIAETSTALDGVTTSANTAKTALSGIGTGIAIGAAIAAVAALAVGFAEVVQNARAAKDATEAFAVDLERLKEASDGVIDRLKQEGKLIQAIDDLEGKTAPQKTADQIANNNREIQALTKNLSDLQKAREELQKPNDLKLADVEKQGLSIVEQEIASRKQLKQLQDENNILAIKQLTEQNKLAEDNNKEAKDELGKRIAILEQIKRIQDELSKGSNQPLFRQVADQGINEKIIQAKIAKAIQDGAKDPANKDAFDQLAAELQKQLSATKNPNLKANIGGIVDVTDDEIAALDKKIFDKFKKIKPIDIPVNVNVDKLLNDLNRILARGLEQTFSTVGDAIASAIGGGAKGVENAGKQILQAVGGLIKDIGKALIEYGIVKQGLDKIIGTGGLAIPGLVAIAVGIAAEAAGALVANAGKSYKALAVGGIVTGPTNALIGEAGPEVVFPLSQLNRFVRGVQTQAQSANETTTVLKGTDIWLLNKRVTKNQGFTG
jgi:hypothetical protein